MHVRGVSLRFLKFAMGSYLKVSSPGGSSLNETSWAISATVTTWKVPVRLMTMGIILTSVLRAPWILSASRSGL